MNRYIDTPSPCDGRDNPFLERNQTPYGAPPFDRIRTEHYVPALMEGIRLHNAELESIVSNPDEPTFENTLVALDLSGELLRNTGLVFFSMVENETSDELNNAAEKMAPLLSKHEDSIFLNRRLFERVRTLFEHNSALNLTSVQKRLLDRYYRKFIRSGAALSREKQAHLRCINEELSVLTLRFSDHVLKETNDFRLVVCDEADLAGLPHNLVESARLRAASEGQPDKWLFTLQKPDIIPFLQYAKNRSLREKMFNAYVNRGNNDNENDNKEIVCRMVNLRLKRANLLGYPHHAAYVLEENMAGETETVLRFLKTVWTRALRKAEKERAEMKDWLRQEEEPTVLEAWDWWYYTEQIRQTKFRLEDSDIRPYFSLELVQKGAFDVARKLYGVQFRKVYHVPVYHPDVDVFEVTDVDGAYLGLFYSDYFPRPGKRSGAWMGNFGEAYLRGSGEHVRPFIYNVGNFTKPVAGAPSLLNREEVETLFHEFGHALHGLLARSAHLLLSGTNVARDFVELPSQIMENWALHPDVLRNYARHYQTGAPLPDEWLEKMVAERTFNQGFQTVELIAAALLDMQWHTLTQAFESDVEAFERSVMENVGLIREIIPRYRSTFFSHIFSGGYAAGYYAYLWAEVLDADAFEAFLEKGIFDPQTAGLFRKNILERGDEDDPVVLYRLFRGADPDPKRLFERRGL